MKKQDNNYFYLTEEEQKKIDFRKIPPVDFDKFELDLTDIIEKIKVDSHFKNCRQKRVNGKQKIKNNRNCKRNSKSKNVI